MPKWQPRRYNGRRSSKVVDVQLSTVVVSLADSVGPTYAKISQSERILTGDADTG
jgi:hypothetical protein